MTNLSSKAAGFVGLSAFCVAKSRSSLFGSGESSPSRAEVAMRRCAREGGLKDESTTETTFGCLLAADAEEDQRILNLEGEEANDWMSEANRERREWSIAMSRLEGASMKWNGLYRIVCMCRLVWCFGVLFY